MKKIVISILVVVLIAVIILGIYCLINKNKEENVGLKTIQLNEVTRSVFYAPQYVAISNGFFEQEGLKLDITTGQGADKVMTAILSGQSDIGLCGPEAAIYVYNEGKEDYVEVFAQLTKIVIPSNISTFFNTLKVNIGLSLVGVISGEFLVSKGGLGYLIVYGGQVFQLDLVMTSVIILAIVAALMYETIVILEKKIVK